ncbi:hypothetical protein M8C13_32345 [Crossiella sp. SN42]|uniref:preprotein translocase subunit SecA n=1 Tax=Crossiella sp. SN42 TaxID=2944808 RepID=UPI00207CDAAA|nr:hypothetical protein [Crossiella sp. SN42]MCO1580454.1 hypothetical protein [Crossiella sp. SN42]
MTSLRRFGAALDRRIPRALKAAVRVAQAEQHTARQLPDEDLSTRYRELRRSPRARGTAVIGLMAEACRRRLGIRAHPEQLLGAAALASGYAAEMGTGEGKTLTVALAAAVHAMSGAGVHVLTANDYLAARDAELLGPAYALLQLSTGVITGATGQLDRRTAYQATVTYSTVSECGFDYLRDNLVTAAHDRIQRAPHAALLDEADAVLVDDASTPLIITGDPAPGPHEWPTRMAPVLANLLPVVHYEALLADREVAFTDLGWEQLQRTLGLDDRAWHDQDFLNAAQNALQALVLYQYGRDYLVAGNRVVLLDQHTGRRLPDRRLRGGLHAALEAKEGLAVGAEPRTLASISIQRFLRRYPILGGLSGTVSSEAVELHQVYQLPVVTIPTHRPSARLDLPDQLFASHSARMTGLVERVADAHRIGRPVLVGVPTVHDGDDLARHLTALGIDHALLTARDDASEAAVIARAGAFATVTIATALAGRGTDIRLGGDPPEHTEQIRELGGLLVLGLGRGPNRRTDDQLAGRAGRQGDPGAAQFLLSAEDDLLLDNVPEALRLLKPVLTAAGTAPVTGPQAQALAERAQALADSRQYTARKQMLRFDEVVGHQHDAVSSQRLEILATPLPLVLRRFATAVASGRSPDGPLAATLPGTLPSTARLGTEGVAAVLHDHLLAATTREPPDRTRARILAALDHAWSQQLETLLALQSVSHTATWSRTDPVAEYRRLAVHAYAAARRELQHTLLRELLADQPQWTLPARTGTACYLP